MEKGLSSHLEFQYGGAKGVVKKDVVDIDDEEDFPTLGGGPPPVQAPVERP